MNAIVSFIQKLRGVNFVIRWNFHPTNRKENVAEHSFWVAIFTMLLAPDELRDRLVVAALLHDAEEAITGDLPALVKAHVPTWHEVVRKAELELVGDGEHDFFDRFKEAREMAEQSATVKLADLFAALMFAREELQSGNLNFERIERELIQSVVDKARKTPDVETGKRAILLLDALGFDHAMGLARPVEMSHL